MSIPAQQRKPVVGITIGDVNGIGPEIVIKTLADNRILEICTPVLFANNRVINFYRKGIPDSNFNYSAVKDWNRLNTRQVNIFNCWDEEVAITPGQVNETGGRYAVKSLNSAANALKEGQIDVLVTSPVNKKNIYGDDFPFTGHTPFLQSFFGASDVLMLMVAGGFRMGLVTEHIPISKVAAHLNREIIFRKIQILHQSLKTDFNIEKPKIAVLALNPHAGDEGLVGEEEGTVIRPAIKDAKQHNMLVMGPFAADGFFARMQHTQFDGVLAMYHDQGLIPFKSLAMEEGINFTAGLEVIRTSPDHGTAMDIAGKNLADASSLLAAIFEGIDIFNRKNNFEEIRRDPLQRNAAAMMKGGFDEKLAG